MWSIATRVRAAYRAFITPVAVDAVRRLPPLPTDDGMTRITYAYISICRTQANYDLATFAHDYLLKHAKGGRMSSADVASFADAVAYGLSKERSVRNMAANTTAQASSRAQAQKKVPSPLPADGFMQHMRFEFHDGAAGRTKAAQALAEFAYAYLDKHILEGREHDGTLHLCREDIILFVNAVTPGLSDREPITSKLACL
jgi:hypothetical protein